MPRRSERIRFGEYVRSLRRAHGFTQDDLAQAMGADFAAGISALELGLSDLPAAKQEALARALGVSIGDLIAGKRTIH